MDSSSQGRPAPFQPLRTAGQSASGLPATTMRASATSSPATAMSSPWTKGSRRTPPRLFRITWPAIALLCFLRRFDFDRGEGDRGRIKPAVWALTTLLTAMVAGRVAPLMPLAVGFLVYLMGQRRLFSITTGAGRPPAAATSTTPISTTTVEDLQGVIERQGDPDVVAAGNDGCHYLHGVPNIPNAAGHLAGKPTSATRGANIKHKKWPTTTVETVWRDNFEHAFERVRELLRKPRRHLYAALDLEFVAGAATDVGYRPKSWIDWYQHLRAFVNGGKMVQMGLALAFEVEQHGGGAEAPPPVLMALEINLQFNQGEARDYNSASIAFLAEQGHNLAEHKQRGVKPECLGRLLGDLLFKDDSVTWVTFHGDFDFGFLIREQLKQAQGKDAALPHDRTAFVRLMDQTFPVFYDVRVLGQLVKEGFRGKLTALADLLGVQRIGGEHHAGSDALLTLSCYLEICRRFSEHERRRLDSRQCLLSGMEEYDMAIKCARHIDDPTIYTVKVRGYNFNQEASIIREVVRSNFKTIGVDVQVPLRRLYVVAGEHQDYSRIKCMLQGINEFQVVIGFMNAEDMLAYGCALKFYIIRDNLSVSNEGVHPRQLGWLLASCGATHESNVAWVTHRGSQGIACLIKSFLAAEDLPGNLCSYMKHQRAYLPRMYDVGMIAQRCSGEGFMGSCLYETARNLNVIEEADKQPMEEFLPEKALVALRCYRRLMDRPGFPAIASAVQGQLMDSQSCCWYCSANLWCMEP